MTTGDVVYSLRFSLIKILPEPGFDLGSTAEESCVLTARLHMLYCLPLDYTCYTYTSYVINKVYGTTNMVKPGVPQGSVLSVSLINMTLQPTLTNEIVKVFSAKGIEGVLMTLSKEGPP